MSKARNGFTIIEMMIVIVIIAILSGFVFRMMGLAAVKNNIAETKAKLEKIANAIEVMRRKSISRLIIADNNQVLLGIVTRTDLIESITNLKEFPVNTN